MSPVNGPTTSTANPRTGDSDRRTGGRLVATDGRALPLRGVTLRAEARGGLARVALHQRFANPLAEALRVTYLVPLPPDAALAGYAFHIGNRRIAGEVDRLAAALVASLGDADQLELIAFASRPRRWRRQAVRATESARRDAVAWLAALEAEGSTEMREAVVEALRPLRKDAQRQVVLVTDGLIGFEHEIVAALARELPIGSRLHTVGVGSSVNRALIATAARAGRGVEVVVGLGEAVAPHVARLLARMREPVLTEVKIAGPALLDHAPRVVPDVYAGAPLRVALRLRPGGGALHVHGLTAAGAWVADVPVPAVAAGEGRAAVVSLYGREAVEDLELSRAAGLPVDDRDVERIGLEFQIATRLTSWIAETVGSVQHGAASPEARCVQAQVC